jgi:copper chaperone
MEAMLLSVSDMTCGHCVKAITDSVGAVHGVTAVAVDLADKVVRVDGQPDPAAVTAAIYDAGYDVVA